MSRLFTKRAFAVLVWMAGMVCPAGVSAQATLLTAPKAFTNFATISHAQLTGVVRDDRSQPLAGVVVSAIGETSAFAVSNRSGRFTLRDLPSGPYLVRAHLQGYVPARDRVIQITSDRREISIALSRVPNGSGQPQVLQAGVGAIEADDPQSSTDAGEDDSELAWRIRHLKRSVLKNVDTAVIPAPSDGSFVDDSFSTLARVVSNPVRVASDFFADLPLNGQINLLTTTSFDRPENLFSAQGTVPSNVAFVSLTAPTATGRWDVRGGTRQGDLSSWILAGSYTRQSPGAAHIYRAGMSYAMQRYLGGNADALAALADGRRNAGELYAFDTWSIASRIDVSYGARYARYDYLAHEGLFSPKASVTVSPLPDKSFRLRGTVSHREIAPGAEEFLPPTTGMWLPPGRTFSPASPRRGLRPEQVDHLEVAAEEPLAHGIVVGARAFRQRVTDQIVTLFGVSLPDTAGASIGHYYLGNSGDVDIHGWGVNFSHEMAERLRTSIDYTESDANWLKTHRGLASVALVAPSAVRQTNERLRDLTTSVESELPGLDTHLFVIYKLDSGFARSDASTRRPQLGGRFDVQVSQALPFLNFTTTQWEMVVALRNLFHEDVLDGSVYDELQVVRPPKHVVGGVTVRF